MSNPRFPAGSEPHCYENCPPGRCKYSDPCKDADGQRYLAIEPQTEPQTARTFTEDEVKAVFAQAFPGPMVWSGDGTIGVTPNTAWESFRAKLYGGVKIYGPSPEPADESEDPQ